LSTNKDDPSARKEPKEQNKTRKSKLKQKNKSKGTYRKGRFRED